MAGHVNKMVTGTHSKVTGSMGDLYLAVANDVLKMGLDGFPTATRKLRRAGLHEPAPVPANERLGFPRAGSEFSALPRHSDRVARHAADVSLQRLNTLAAKWDRSGRRSDSAADVEARNRFVREKFREMVHGFPDRNPLAARRGREARARWLSRRERHVPEPSQFLGDRQSVRPTKGPDRSRE